MDKSKVLEYFDGRKIEREEIHIIGLGAIGSHVAEQLARIGCITIHLWDFDVVNPHNITNQLHTDADIGRPKVDAVYDMMLAINPELATTVYKHNCAVVDPYILNGYIFLCADSMDVRRNVVKANEFNMNAKAIFDFRMRLTDAQHYAAHFKRPETVKELLKTMDFTDAEAKEATPVSACGVELSVIYNVKAIVSFGICNFVNFIQTGELKTKVLVNMKLFAVDAF